MVPKMEGCLHAVRNGVTTARVIDGRVQHSILLEIFTDEGIGTMVVPDELDREVRQEEVRQDRQEAGGCRMTANEELTQRWQGALMNNYGTPKLPSSAARAPSSVDADGNGVRRLRRRDRGQRARPRPPGDRRGRQQADRRTRPCLQPVHRRTARRPRRTAARALRPGRQGVLLQLGRRGQRGAFKIGRLTGRSTWSPPTAASTAARWAPSRSPASPPSRSRSCRCPAMSRTCRTATRRRSPPPSPTRPRSSSSSRSRARTAWSYRPPAT
jgi:hypothetical protein